MVRTPKLDQLGRAYSEMSPLNPPLSAHSTATTSSAAGGHERRDSGGYGSIFPFGFFRSSFGRSGNSIQVGKQSVFFHSIRHMFRCLTVVCLCVRLGLSDKRYRYTIPYAIHTYIYLWHRKNTQTQPSCIQFVCMLITIILRLPVGRSIAPDLSLTKLCLYIVYIFIYVYCTTCYSYSIGSCLIYISVYQLLFKIKSKESLDSSAGY